MSARVAIVLQHTPTEGPERVAELLTQRGVQVDVRALYDGVPVPRDLAPGELLLVMGGPMGVGDAGSPQYPFLAGEIELLAKLVARDAPVLGICLGSQLLAAGAGARVYPNTRPGPNGAPVPAREVGWGPIDLFTKGPSEGPLDPPRASASGASPSALTRPNPAAEPALAGLGTRVPVLHWHGDTFDLPRGAVHFASTPLCKHQAFRLGRRQYGLQFHPELRAETIATWVSEDADYVRAANGPDGGAHILADTARLYDDARPSWDRLLGNIISLMLVGES